jgi:hypothetical protein
MNLSLEPKGHHPDLFELGPTEIRVQCRARPRFEVRSPYKSLSATYRVSSSQPIRKVDLVGKLIAFSILPALFLYYSIEVGWLLAVFAILLSTPLLFVIRSACRKATKDITFIEHADGDFAFYIPYYADEEARVLEFVREIQRRIENEKNA